MKILGYCVQFCVKIEIIIESVNCNDQLVGMLKIFGDLNFNVFLLNIQRCYNLGEVLETAKNLLELAVKFDA